MNLVERVIVMNIFFFLTYGFGTLFSFSWLHLVGIFFLAVCLFLIGLASIASGVSLRRREYWSNIFFAIAFVGVVRLAFNLFDSSDAVTSMRKISNYLDFFLYNVGLLLFFFFRRLSNIEFFLRFLVFSNLLAAVSYLFNKLGVVDSGFRFSVDANSGVTRIDSSFFYLHFLFGVLSLSNFFENRVKYWSLLSYCVSVLILFDSFFRVFSLGLIFLSVALTVLNNRNRFRGAWFFLALVLVLGFIPGEYMLRALSAWDDIASLEGTSLSRLAIVVVRWDAIVQQELYWGFGFNALPVFDLTIEEQISIPNLPDQDSGLGSLLVVFGPVGVTVVMVLYLYDFFRGGSFQSGFEISGGAARLVLWYALLTSAFRDYFITQYAVIFFATTLALYLQLSGNQRKIL